MGKGVAVRVALGVRVLVGVWLGAVVDVGLGVRVAEGVAVIVGRDVAVGEGVDADVDRSAMGDGEAGTTVAVGIEAQPMTTRDTRLAMAKRRNGIPLNSLANQGDEVKGALRSAQPHDEGGLDSVRHRQAGHTVAGRAKAHRPYNTRPQ